MLYNNTASINYLEFDRINPSSSSTNIEASITASNVVVTDYTGTVEFLTYSRTPLISDSTDILSANTTSEVIVRTTEIPNNKIQYGPNNGVSLEYTSLLQNVTNTSSKTWRYYVNSTSSLAGATLLFQQTMTNIEGSILRRAQVYTSGSTLWIYDTNWGDTLRSVLPYDIVSSSIFFISTVQKSTGTATARSHYAHVVSEKTMPFSLEQTSP
jgi:hypothetical protein